MVRPTITTVCCRQRCETMISIRKLSSLNKKNALRKTAALLQGFEYDLIAGKHVDIRYLRELVTSIIAPADPGMSQPSNAALSTIGELERTGEESSPGQTAPAARPEILRRVCNDLRHLIYTYLDSRPADWDLMFPAGAASAITTDNRRVLPLLVFLEDLRSPFNVGSIFRSAESFCVKQVILTPSCPSPDTQRASRSAMGCDKLVPWTTGGLNLLDGEKVFALETGGTAIEEFPFPDHGAVIVGNEELGVSPEARRRAADSAGIVSIPLFGVKGSLSVTAAFAILMHHWCNRLLPGG